MRILNELQGKTGLGILLLIAAVLGPRLGMDAEQAQGMLSAAVAALTLGVVHKVGKSATKK